MLGNVRLHRCACRQFEPTVRALTRAGAVGRPLSHPRGVPPPATAQFTSTALVARSRALTNAAFSRDVQRELCSMQHVAIHLRYFVAS
jgi:hypothetical protein